MTRLSNEPVTAGSWTVDVEVTVAKIVRGGRVSVVRSVSVTSNRASLVSFAP